MSTIGGSKSGWRAGGDKGNQPFSMSDEQWDRIFAPKPAQGCGDPDCHPGCRNYPAEPAAELPCEDCASCGACEHGEYIYDDES